MCFMSVHSQEFRPLMGQMLSSKVEETTTPFFMWQIAHSIV